MLNTCSIGRRWKPREGWSRPVLTGERGTLSDPFLCGGLGLVLWWFLVGWQGMLFLVVTRRKIEAFCSRPLSGSRTATIGIVAWFRFCRPILVVGRCIGFAVVMAQVRRPVPFRTRKLRPGRGDGTALERVWESSTPPHSTSGFPSSVTLREPPFFVFWFPGDPRARRSGSPLFLFPHTGVFLRPLEVFGRRKDCRREDSSTHWAFCSAGRPVGGRIAPVTGSPGTLGDPRNSRGASCPYPMVE